MTGDEGNYNMKGLWMMRGTDKLSNLDLVSDMEYYNYKKLDPKKEEDWKIIKEFLNVNKDSIEKDKV